jgi:hypothetical protein
MNPHLLIEAILAVSILLSPIALLIHRTRVKKADGSNFGLGVRMVQFVAATSLPPVLIILGLEGLLDRTGVATLLGVFVGYLFSNISEFDKSPRADRDG